jgi:predicted transcriptional regulator
MNAQRSLFHDTAPTFDEVMSAWAGDRNWRSRKDIAAALGRSKSPALITVIEMLVQVGYLTKRTIDLPNGADYFQYAVSQKYVDQAAPF